MRNEMPRSSISINCGYPITGMDIKHEIVDKNEGTISITAPYQMDNRHLVKNPILSLV